MAVGVFGPLCEPPAAFGLMEAKFPAHGASYIHKTIVCVFNQRATLNTLTEGASIWLAFPILVSSIKEQAS